MKKLFGLFLIALISVSLASCDNSTETGEEAYVQLDINPEIELLVSNNKVVEVYAYNDDAKVLLYEEESLEGKDFEDALEVITELCIEQGYLEEDNKVIDYTVNSTAGEDLKKKLEDKIEKVMADKANKLGLKIKTQSKGVFSLQCSLEELKEAYPDNEAIQNLSLGQYKLIVSAQSSEETLTIEAAVEMSTKELIDIIKESRDEAYNIASKKYDELVSETKAEYEKVLKNAERAVYAAYYVKDLNTIIDHPVNYGSLYAMYGTAADSLDFVVKIAEKTHNYMNQILTEEEVNAIVSKIEELNVTKEEIISGITNEEGNITIESINEYLDNLVKNIEDEELKNEIEQLRVEFKNVKDKVKEKHEKIHADYKNQIDAIVKTIEVTKTTIEVAVAALPESYKAAVNEYLNEMDLMVQTIEAGLKEDCDLETIKTWIEDFRTKEAQILETIENDLSEEELAEIEELKAKVEEKANNAKDKFDKAVKDAHNQCRVYLHNKKGQKVNNPKR